MGTVTCIRFKALTGPRRGFLCTSDSPEVDPNPDCPNADRHEPWPTGYIASSEKADRMLETHDQHDCPGCGRLLIWTPKETP
jgi:hypothetical protein